MNTGTIAPARETAAVRAGLSARRRSRRNQTIEVFGRKVPLLYRQFREEASLAQSSPLCPAVSS